MSANLSSKKICLCECTGFAFVTGDTVSLEFAWSGPAPRGGQFFLIKPRRTGVFLGRPISVAGWKPVPKPGGTKVSRETKASGNLRFLVALRGQGSRDIANMRPGEEAELIGPLGNSWPLDNDDIPTDISAGPVALVAGGIGIAPLMALAPELGNRPYDLYAGFRSGSFGLENLKPRTLLIATEDGSQGVKGRVLDFFAPAGYSRVFACGPEPMLKALSDSCVAGGVPCFISVERYMACGVGACLGCTVKTAQGNRRCCADGPIFDARELCFEA